VLLITGLLLVVAAAIALPIMRQAAIIQTDAKLANIAKAIDFYATQNYRVPCPAAVPDTATTNPPFGYEAGSSAAGDVVPANCGAATTGWEGIVPFKTLNIPVDWVRDAWGNYITYAISPNFSQDVTTDIPVHARCRTSDWFGAALIYSTYDPIAKKPGLVVLDPLTGLPANNVLTPKNERKARFCCGGAASPATDLVIEDVNGNSQIAFSRLTSMAVTVPPAAPPAVCGASDCSSYKSANVSYPNPMVSNVQVPDNDRPTAPVYILISHGRNGYGAYLGQGVGVRLPKAGATPAEIVNASGNTGNRTYFEIPAIDRTSAGPTNEMNYDDVVVWRTQDMMFASQGKSCSLP
jgi:hypothetical protein